MDLRYEPRHFGVLQPQVGLIEQFLCFVDDQLVPDIIFIPEIQIKGSFRHAGSVHNIRDRRPRYPLGRKQLKGAVKQRFPFLFLIHFYCSNIIWILYYMLLWNIYK